MHVKSFMSVCVKIQMQLLIVWELGVLLSSLQRVYLFFINRKADATQTYMISEVTLRKKKTLKENTLHFYLEWQETLVHSLLAY